MMISDAVRPLPLPDHDPTHRWFTHAGCVVDEGERKAVYVGGMLVATFSREETGRRNALLVALAQDHQVHIGRLCEVFDVSVEGLRKIRHAYAQGAERAIWDRARGGSESKVTPRMRRKLEKLFEAGASVREAHARLERDGLSCATVGRVRKGWDERRRGAVGKQPLAPASASSPQVELPMSTRSESGATSSDAALAQVQQAPAQDEHAAPSPVGAPATESTATARLDVAAGPVEVTVGVPNEHAAADATEVGSPEEREGWTKSVEPRAPESGRSVQHVGSWVLLTMMAQLGLYRRAERARVGSDVEADALRVVIDAVTVAFAVGERCVEGVRRLGTPTAPKLLRVARAPSASWVRGVLHEFSNDITTPRLHVGMAGEYLRAASAGASERVLFYVDNHLRPYTGKRVVRRGWRMQDKRVRPGTTDYYLHDEDGRPVLRIDVPSHDTLGAFLGPIAGLVRTALPDETLLFAFDRAGAYPVELAKMRARGVECVTYERRPYPLLAPSAFERQVEFDDETLRFTESRANLGGGHGRARRISVCTPDGRQVNLLAISEAEPERLIAAMRGRWNQENGFKHGVERWGINQLDGRKVASYPPGTVVPNPARRRLDRALRLARAREGEARRLLALLGKEHRRQGPLERDLADSLAEQRRLQELRPTTPKRAPLEETELAGKLVKHEGNYKTTLDTIRIACANAESELAARLAVRMRKPREAKKALANLLRAPGHVRVSRDLIDVRLLPAGTTSELHAIAALLRDLDRDDLALPGDRQRRHLRFRLQLR